MLPTLLQIFLATKYLQSYSNLLYNLICPLSSFKSQSNNRCVTLTGDVYCNLLGISTVLCVPLSKIIVWGDINLQLLIFLAVIVFRFIYINTHNASWLILTSVLFHCMNILYLWMCEKAFLDLHGLFGISGLHIW